MKPRELIVRCYAERKDGLWQAICLDLNLAAQAGSFEQARHKLHVQISEYVEDALCGPDREHADQLLTRRAPLGFFAKYYYMRARSHVSHIKNGVFNEVLPLNACRA